MRNAKLAKLAKLEKFGARRLGFFFDHFIGIKIAWGSAEKIIKMRPTVAE